LRGFNGHSYYSHFAAARSVLAPVDLAFNHQHGYASSVKSCPNRLSDASPRSYQILTSKKADVDLFAFALAIASESRKHNRRWSFQKGWIALLGYCWHALGC